jgi:5-methylcytosine-specific restriction endonuclease McrA
LAVFVLDKRKKPLMRCSQKGARLLLTRGRAAVHRGYPLTIRLKDRIGGEVQPVRVKLDPASKTAGIAVVTEEDSNKPAEVFCLFEFSHRGRQISKALTARGNFRHHRGDANLCRAPRFNNRTRPEGSLGPSLHRRVDTVGRIVRLRRWAPLSAISAELGRFGHRCGYCGAVGAALSLDHVVPRSRRGSNRVSHLVPSSIAGNQDSKQALSIEQFLAYNPKRLAAIQAQLKAPLQDARMLQHADGYGFAASAAPVPSFGRSDFNCRLAPTLAIGRD